MRLFVTIFLFAAPAFAASAVFLDESPKPDDSRLGSVVTRDGYRIALPKGAREGDPGRWRATLPEGGGMILTARVSSAEEPAPAEYRRFVLEKSLFAGDEEKKSLGNYASLASHREGPVWLHDWQSSTSDSRGTITSLHRTFGGFRSGTLRTWSFECGWAGDQPAVRSICAAALASVRLTSKASDFASLASENPKVGSLTLTADPPPVPELCPSVERLIAASRDKTGFSKSKKLIALLPSQKSAWRIEDAGAGKGVSADVTDPQDPALAKRSLSAIAKQLESCVPAGWKSETQSDGAVLIGEPIIGIGSAVKLRTVTDSGKREHVQVQVLEKAVLSFAE